MILRSGSGEVYCISFGIAFSVIGCSILSILPFIDGQMGRSFEKTPSRPLDKDYNDTGLCSGDPDHRLSNVSSFFHTPWLDEAFCKYPPRIHASRSGSVPTDAVDECEDELDKDGDRVNENYSSRFNNASAFCDQPAGKRSRQAFSRWTLPFCSDYKVERLLGGHDQCIFQAEKEQCRNCMENLYQLDRQVKYVYCHFVRDIMARFDCETRFSIIWNCTHCQVKFKNTDLFRTRRTNMYLPLLQSF